MHGRRYMRRFVTRPHSNEQSTSPEHPSTVADLCAIVTYVAYRVLQSDFDYSEHDLRETYPQLRGITSEQLQTAIQEGLD